MIEFILGALAGKYLLNGWYIEFEDDDEDD